MTTARRVTTAGATMEAILFEEFGGPEVLRHTTDAAVPVPGPGEVRLRVAAAGVNPMDWKVRRGLLEEFFPTTFPAVPGIEVDDVDSTAKTLPGFVGLWAGMLGTPA